MFNFKKQWHSLERLQERNPTLYFAGDLFLNIIIIVLLVYGVRTYLLSPFQVYGPSMCDSLNNINNKCQGAFGDYLIVNKAVYHPFFGHSYRTPERGDVVVFKPPHNESEYYIKRVIGVPGDRVRLQNGRVYIMNKEHQSEWELPEPYLNADNKNRTYPFPAHIVATYTVPDGAYFVLGDNRNKSTDSRTCFKGPQDPECNDVKNHFLPVDRIEGRAAVVLWPFENLELLANPDYEALAQKQ